MTQEERWLTKYNEVMDFIESHHRNPSRHRIEEHDMLNWLVSMKKDVFFLYESGMAERQGLNKVITFLRRAKPA